MGEMVLRGLVLRGISQNPASAQEETAARGSGRHVW